MTCTQCRYHYDGPTSVALGEIGFAKVVAAGRVESAPAFETHDSIPQSKVGENYSRNVRRSRYILWQYIMASPRHALPSAFLACN